MDSSRLLDSPVTTHANCITPVSIFGMKILMTGFTRGQAQRYFHRQSQLEVVPSHYSLVNCLLAMGHEVEQRVVEPGDDLSMYDEAIIYLSNPNSICSVHTYGALYAISQHPDCIFAVDDWPVKQTFQGLIKGRLDKVVFHHFWLRNCHKSLEKLQPYQACFEKAFETLAAKRNRLLISAFSTDHLNPHNKSDHGIHIITDKISYPRDRVFTFNPNPYHRNRTWENPHHSGPEDPTYLPPPTPPHPILPRPQKSHNFNFASLAPQHTQKFLKSQHLTGNPNKDPPTSLAISTWPVHLYGKRPSPKRPSSSGRLKESEMIRTITRDWGCLMPGYEHAGSGWWRARPLQCADAGSILIGEEKELRVLYGEGYKFFGLKARDLTSMMERELQDVAAEQRACLDFCHPIDREVQKGEVGACLGAER